MQAVETVSPQKSDRGLDEGVTAVWRGRHGREPANEWQLLSFPPSLLWCHHIYLKPRLLFFILKCGKRFSYTFPRHRKTLDFYLHKAKFWLFSGKRKKLQKKIAAILAVSQQMEEFHQEREMEMLTEILRCPL